MPINIPECLFQFMFSPEYCEFVFYRIHAYCDLSLQDSFSCPASTNVPLRVYGQVGIYIEPPACSYTWLRFWMHLKHICIFICNRIFACRTRKIKFLFLLINFLQMHSPRIRILLKVNFSSDTFITGAKAWMAPQTSNGRYTCKYAGGASMSVYWYIKPFFFLCS